MSGSSWFSNMISFAVISAASLGLKPRFTNPLARAMKLSGLRDATGWCVAQSFAQSAAFELMRGAGVVAPELAKLEQQRERLRYDREERVITFLRNAGRLRPGLSHKTARDIFWMFTGGDVYRMLVRERGWSPQKYQDWL